MTGSQGEFLGELRRGSDTDVATKCEASSDAFRGVGQLVLRTFRRWREFRNKLGLKELGEPEREGGSESGESRGTTYHNLYGEVLEGCCVERYDVFFKRGGGAKPPTQFLFGGKGT